MTSAVPAATSRTQLVTVRPSAQLFLTRADNMAQEIIASNTQVVYEGPTVIRHYHYYNDPFWYNPWYSRGPSVVVVNPERPSSNSDKKKKDEAAAIVAAAAVIIGGITLYYLGSGITRYQDASNELEDTKAFQKEQSRYVFNGTPEEQSFNQTVMQVADLKDRVCTRIKNSAAWDVALRTGLLGSCGVALAGALSATAVPASMMAYGVYGITAFAGGMLFKAGLDSSEAQNFRDAATMQSLIQGLKA